MNKPTAALLLSLLRLLQIVAADTTFHEDFSSYVNYSVVDTFSNETLWNLPTETLFGPLSHWHFNNDSTLGESAVLAVDSQRFLNLTVNGSSQVPNGSFAGDAYFDYNGINNSLTSQPTNFSGYPLTISAWVRTNHSGNATTPGTVVNLISGNDLHYAGFAVNGSRINLETRNNSVTSKLPSTGITVNDGEWHHIVVQFVNSTYREIYFDGAFNRNSTTSVTWSSSTRSVVIAKRQLSDNSQAYNGSLDDVALYNKTLAPGQIYAIYAKGKSQRLALRNQTEYAWNCGYYTCANLSFTAAGQFYTRLLNGTNLSAHEVLKLWMRATVADNDAVGLELRDMQGHRVVWNIASNSNVLRRNILSINDNGLGGVVPHVIDSGFNWSDTTYVLRVAEDDASVFPYNFSIDDLRLTQVHNDANPVWNQTMTGEWNIVNDTGTPTFFGVTYKDATLNSRIAYTTLNRSAMYFTYSYIAQEYNPSSDDPGNIDTLWTMFPNNWTGDKDASPSCILFVRNNLSNPGEQSDNTLAIKGRNASAGTPDTFIVTEALNYTNPRFVQVTKLNNNIKVTIGTRSFNYFPTTEDCGVNVGTVRAGQISFRVPGAGLIQSFYNFTLITYDNISYVVNTTNSYAVNATGTVIAADAGINFSRSGNAVTITSNLSVPVNAALQLPTGGITPGIPRVVWSNGTTEYFAVYAYANGMLSVNVSSLPPGVSNLTLDSGLPNITVLGPENASSDRDGSLNFTYLVSGNISNCSLSLANGTVIQANGNVSTSAENSFTVSGVDGDHPLAWNPLRWMVQCTSAAGNSVNSSVFDLVTYTGPVQSGGGGTGSGGTDAGSSAGTSTQGATNASNRNYEVTIERIDATVRPSGQVSAVVRIKTIGKSVPQQLGVLSYTVQTPTGDKYPAVSLDLIEGEYTKTITYPLPATAVEGEHQLVVTWNAKDLAPLTQTATFTVSTDTAIPLWVWIAGGCIIGLLLLWLLALLISALFSSGGGGLLG